MIPYLQHHAPRFAFIDADNIYLGVKRILRNRGHESLIDTIDLKRLFRSHGRCFVYHAKKDQDDLPSWILDIQRSTGFVVKTGRTTEKSGRTKQQGVDVWLAIDAMQHSYRRSMTSCVLYTGDGDFLPLVNALVENGTIVTVASCSNPEKGDVPNELRNRADEYVHIDHRALLNIRERECKRPCHTTASVHPSIMTNVETINHSLKSKNFSILEHTKNFNGSYKYYYKISEDEFYCFDEFVDFDLWVSLENT